MPDAPDLPDYVREHAATLPHDVTDAVDALTAIAEHVCEEGFHAVEPDLVEAARHALAATVDHGDAAEHLNDFLHADGPRTPSDLIDAVQIWIDMTAPVWGGRLTSRDTEHVYSFLITDARTGRPLDPNNASEEELWAGRVITARLSDDRDMFVALCNNLADNDDTHTLVHGAMAVLHICAEAVRDAY